MKRITKRKDNRKAKALLKLYGIKYPEIGAKANPPVDPTTVSVVLGGHRTSENIKKTVTRILKSYDPKLTDLDIWEEKKGKAA